METPMLRFCGFDLELFVDMVVSRREWPTLCSARDAAGGHWLIVQVDADPAHLVWLCAPISERGVQVIVEGRGAAVDALRHSLTGTVEVVTIDYGRAVPDRCLLCAQLAESLLTSLCFPANLAA
jgi:hypothetical protein